MSNKPKGPAISAVSQAPTLDRIYDAALLRITGPHQGHMKREDWFDALNADERFAVHVWNLNGQWVNGGLLQYFENGYGDAETLGYLDRALRRVGTPNALRVAEMLKRADEVYDTFRANDRADDRGHERAHNNMMERLDPLDNEYYGPLGDAFMADCEAYASGSNVTAKAVDAIMATAREAGTCTYPDCKCIVSTSTTNPEPVCPLGLSK